MTGPVGVLGGKDGGAVARISWLLKGGSRSVDAVMAAGWMQFYLNLQAQCVKLNGIKW